MQEDSTWAVGWACEVRAQTCGRTGSSGGEKAKEMCALSGRAERYEVQKGNATQRLGGVDGYDTKIIKQHKE